MNLIGRAAPAAPSLILQSAQDELTPKKPVDEFVAAACAQGATIDYRTPPGEHATGSAFLGQYVVPYIQDRFAGKPAPNTCPPRAGKPTAPRPAVSTLRVATRKRHGRIKVKATYTLNAAATVTFKLVRKKTGRKVRTITRSGAAGANSFSFTGRLAAGTYKLTATPAGGRSKAVTFKVTGSRRSRHP
jgi:hypothetical protein